MKLLDQEILKKRRKKLNVAPGQSISYDDFINQLSTSSGPSNVPPKTKIHRTTSVDSTDSNSIDSVQYKESSSDFSELDEEESTVSIHQW